MYYEFPEFGWANIICPADKICNTQNSFMKVISRSAQRYDAGADIETTLL